MFQFSLRKLFKLTAVCAVLAWAYVYLEFNIGRMMTPASPVDGTRHRIWFCQVSAGDTTLFVADSTDWLITFWPFYHKNTDLWLVR
jgi:hypothetical protein